MREIVAWIDTSPQRTALALILATLLPLLIAAHGELLPLQFVISGGLLTLSVLRHEFSAALRVAAMASIVIVVLLAGLGVPASATVVTLVVVWLPALGLGALLKRSRSLSLTTQVAVAIGTGLLLLAYSAGDPSPQWRALLAEQTEAFARIGRQPEPQEIALMAQVASGLTLMVVTLMALAGIYLGRWWQALLDKPGAFGAEFRELRLGKMLAVLAAVSFIGPMLLQSVVLLNLAFVMVGAFALQGLAVAHALRRKAGFGSVWLLLVYLPFLLVAVAWLPFVAAVGYLDTWLNWREKWA